MPEITVILCTRNPRRDYLGRTLDALRRQSMALEHWELLLVDNGSTPPLEPSQLVGWHPQGRLVVEGQAGLTRARLAGIREARGLLLVFVDDDNVLADDYLENAGHIAATETRIGIFGGAIHPEFEQPPEPWTRPCWEMLAIREVTQDVWSNFSGHHTHIPCGAGMCMRKFLAEEWARRVMEEPLRLVLGRSGTSLSAGEDNDMVQTVYGQGMGAGVFAALRLTHLIPPGRLERDYLLRLAEAIAHSLILLRAVHGDKVAPPSISWLARLNEWRRSWGRSRFENELAAARKAGVLRALRDLAQQGAES
jgi:glycosyltransferase involved in cell wall biosynthesis